jgi:hypothetical protein
MVCAAVEKIGPVILKSIDYTKTNTAKTLLSLQAQLQNETYILSLCEHGSDKRADRLSMWKDFGDFGRGLCMVLRKDTILGQTAKGLFPVHWAPIEYENAALLENRVRQRLMCIEDALTLMPKAVLDVLQPAMGNIISTLVLQLVLSHKNEHFYDEREVRFIRSNLLNSNPAPADAVLRVTNTAKGKRSKFILPLRKYPEYGIDAALESLLDHVIIGPSKNQLRAGNEVKTALVARGIGSIPIILSTIPYDGDR